MLNGFPIHARESNASQHSATQVIENNRYNVFVEQSDEFFYMCNYHALDSGSLK